MKTKKDKIKSFKSMIESCYAYGGISVSSFYYDKYIYPFKEELGDKIFNKVYNEHKEYLEQNYTIKTDVYTDNEDVSYNSLIKK